MTDVFISNAHPDDDFAQRLGEALQAAGKSVWQAKGAIRPGDIWQSTISQEIAKARNIVVIVSSRSASSNAQRAEIALALSQNDKRIVPVRIDPRAKLPLLLQGIQAIDWSDEAGPGQAQEELLAALTGKSAAGSQEDTDFRRRLVEIESEALRFEKILLASERRMLNYRLLVTTFGLVVASLAVLAAMGAFSASAMGDNLRPFLIYLVGAIMGALAGIGPLVARAWFARRLNRLTGESCKSTGLLTEARK